MPVNATSTGATYGKSSDPLCPLGFHPQVRWPTRCKRCFRDYKEHADDRDKARFGNLKDNDSDPWPTGGRRPDFQKSRSLDVNIESSVRQRFGRNLSTESDDVATTSTSSSSRYSTPTTSAATTAATSSSTTTTTSWSSNRYSNSYRSQSVQPAVSSSREEAAAAAAESSFYGIRTPSSVNTSSTSPSAASSTWGSASNSAETTTESEPSTATGYSSGYGSSSYSNSAKANDNAGGDGWWGSSGSGGGAGSSGGGRSGSQRGATPDQNTSSTSSKKTWGRSSQAKIEEPAPPTVLRRTNRKWEPPKKDTSISEDPKPSSSASSSSAAAARRRTRQSSTESTSSDYNSNSNSKPAAAVATTTTTSSGWSTSSWSNEPSNDSWYGQTTNKADEGSRSSTNNNGNNNSYYSSPADNSTSSTWSSSSTLKNDQNGEVGRLKKEIGELQTENKRLKVESTRPMSFESAKATETASELRKAREKMHDQEMSLSSVEQEKNCLVLKLKELESVLNKRPQVSETNKAMMELQTKLKFLDRKVKDLERENDGLQSNVQNLEGELEEVQDNFREDEDDEYRIVKRRLEALSKDNRVLSFKLKKSEKSVNEMSSEKTELEGRLKQMSGGSSALDNINRIRKLEKELELKAQQAARYEAQISDLKLGKMKMGATMAKPGPVLSRTGSVERSLEDQILKDLQDSVERETDLKEQLERSEEESKDHTLKLSRLEDENESLVQQLKKMSSGGSGKGGLRGGGGVGGNVSDMKLQLEVSETETSVLRKKVENLLSENLRLNKDVKDLNAAIGEEKKKKSGTPTGAGGWRNNNSSNASQLDELQTELNTTRIKLIERERDFERLETQLRSAKATAAASNSGGGARRGEDLQAKMEVIEKEARVLRERNAQLESENEKLQQETKQKYGRKPPASTHEKLQMDKFALEEKVRTMEGKVKEANKRAEEAERQSGLAKQDSGEVTRLRREKANLERDLKAAKDSQENEGSKMRRLERDVAAETEKLEKSQREVIQAQREKRQLEEDKSAVQRSLSKAESSLRRAEEECDSIKRKNSSNLQQTQEGIKQFKDEIDRLKSEVQEEKRRQKDAKRQVEEAARGEAEKSDARVKDLEDKWAKSKRINQQRKDKIDQLEKQLEQAKAEPKPAASSWNKKDNEDMTKKYELLEEEFVIAKATWTSENEGLQREHGRLIGDYETIQRELATLRTTYNSKNDDWIKEKLELQRRLRDLEDSIRNSAGEGWEVERERFKQIIEDRDAQIMQLKIEGDVARSQASALRKDVDDLKVKLIDYEKMSKFQKVVSTDSEAVSNLESKVGELKKQMKEAEKAKKTDMNMQKMTFDSKIALMEEEIHTLNSRASKYRRERETYKEMVEGLQKNRPPSRGPGGSGGGNADKDKINELQFKIQVLEDELGDAKLEASKANASMNAVQSTHEIQIAEMHSKQNELEEAALVESGRARIAGTRTKMELAWQKERESQKKLISELSTMSRDLKATLLEVEKEKDREKLESRRKNDTMKSAFEEEQEDSKRQITDLQYDLLELRDAHAKLRTTNEKLRRDQERAQRERDDLRGLVKDRSRSEQGEEKKVVRFLSEIDRFVDAAKKAIDGGDSTRLKRDLSKLKESKDELEQIHKLSEEERDRQSARRAIMKRAGSTESAAGAGEGSDSPARSLRPRDQSQQRLSSSRRKLDTISGSNDALIWKSVDSTSGSRESLASNASSSIPLPVPVRTRSNTGRGGGSMESGYSTDAYNTLSIRRLERDTSVDRLSTGSRESNRSTQSEWVRGEKSKSKKNAGLIGKLKKLTRGMSAEREREFGSGSDISSVSVASKTSRTSSVAPARSSSKSATGATAKKNPNDQKNPNDPFDKYFSSNGGKGGSAARARAPSGGSTASEAKAASSATAASSSSKVSAVAERYNSATQHRNLWR